MKNHSERDDLGVEKLFEASPHIEITARETKETTNKGSVDNTSPTFLAHTL